MEHPAPQLSRSCEQIFSGDFIAEVEVKQAALAWIPEAMRFVGPADDDPADGSAGEQPIINEDRAGARVISLDGCAAEEIEEAA